MSLDLTTYTLDLNKFMKYPKCVGQWEDGQDKKCLLSAFVSSLGLETDGSRITIDDHSFFIDSAINQAAMKLGIADYDPNQKRYAQACLNTFDSRMFGKAFDLINELIKVWPKVINTEVSMSDYLDSIYLKHSGFRMLWEE